MSMEDTLISKLIEETCVESHDNDCAGEVVNLQHYFEKKLNEVDYISLKTYIEQNKLHVETILLQQKSSCYRVIVNQSTLDFPSNWSIFEHIAVNDLLFIDSYNDQDYLLDLFSEITGASSNIVIAKEQGHLYMVFLPIATSNQHLSWMRNFFEVRENQDQKKAA